MHTDRIKTLLEKQKLGIGVLSTTELIELELLRAKIIKFGIIFDGRRSQDPSGGLPWLSVPSFGGFGFVVAISLA